MNHSQKSGVQVGSGWPYNREQATSASGASTCKAQHVSVDSPQLSLLSTRSPQKKDRSTAHCRANYTVCVASARSQVSEAAAAADHRRQLDARLAAGILLRRVDVEEVARIEVERAEGEHGRDDRAANLRALADGDDATGVVGAERLVDLGEWPEAVRVVGARELRLAVGEADVARNRPAAAARGRPLWPAQRRA
jgi:hypothetical protein